MKRALITTFVLASLLIGLATGAFGEEAFDLPVSSMTMAMSQTYELHRAVTPAGAVSAITWTSADESVATVTGGVVTARRGGSTTVTARYGATEKHVTVYVSAVAAKSVKLNAKSATISPGYTFTLKATISPANSSYKTVDWVSSAPGIASVDETGSVRGVSIGVARITGTVPGGGPSATCVVKVSNIPVKSVKMAKSKLTLLVGTEKQLSCVVKPATAFDASLRWTSSDPEVAQVDETGLVTTLKPGKTMIRATVNNGSGKSAACLLTVTGVRVTSVTLSETYVTMDVGDKVRLTCEVLPENATSPDVTYKSSNSAVASVSETGEITAVKSGGVSIVAAADGKTDVVRVLVRTQKAATKILVSGVGDITLGGDPRDITQTAYQYILSRHEGSYATFLRNFASTLKSDDLTIANLECTLTNATAHANKSHVMKAPPEYVAILSAGGVDACNLANNHSNDFGAPGRLETQAALKNAGIQYCGGGTVSVMTVNGVKVGLCGFHVYDTGVSAAVKTVKALSQKCDVVIASVHWGVDFVYTVSAAQMKYGRALVDAGADLILGHHPHVVSGIEVYKGKYIVYSLGTFSSCIANPADKDAFVFQQTLLVSADGVEDGGIRIIPASMSSNPDVNNCQPVQLTGSDAARVLDKIRLYSKSFPVPAKIA